MYHAYHITAGEVARDADLYYEALLRAGKVSIAETEETW